VESVLSKEQRAAMEAEARQQAEKAALLGVQLNRLQETNELMQSDRRALQTQLLMSEASNHTAVAQILQLADEVAARRQENVHLADGIKALAQEVHVSHPADAQYDLWTSCPPTGSWPVLRVGRRVCLAGTPRKTNKRKLFW